ncbi:LysM peptidoglycan-binding domain-containing protein [Pseudanabaena sp. FACHB-2040]|uniref:LysM peptidoglycan-binding domain-containing protein n=1 Tax=Pseudanabaena sp. FACHB-2040 TaxID=2692859 RepID=UPI00168970D3|nr:LysM peptidoglycan-binding domain-containing protein [Pseudanabaena sp. FACHB-2040]MBD2256647.1 LysM peptidoglycan-binding domain-containing protein [Pseudanabaena sp. FACHB-2040]
MSTQPLNRQYTLSSGDSLDLIAHQLLGDQSNWRELADINDIDIFEQLPIGQSIQIPTQEQVGELVAQAQAQIQQTVTSTLESVTQQLNLSGIKQPEAAGEYNLISWIL